MCRLAVPKRGKYHKVGECSYTWKYRAGYHAHGRREEDEEGRGEAGGGRREAGEFTLQRSLSHTPWRVRIPGMSYAWWFKGVVELGWRDAREGGGVQYL